MAQRSQTFVTPVFRGGRFEAHALPLEVAAELVAYRDLVFELAAHLLKAREPHRQRLPRGFADSFRLAIREVRPGSVEMAIDRVWASSAVGEQLHLQQSVFDEARDLIEETITCARDRGAVPEAFPTSLVTLFNRFGRGLRADESVELRSANRPSGPIYDQNVRKRIVLARENSYQDTLDDNMYADGGELERGLVVLRTADSSRRRMDGSIDATKVAAILKLAPALVRVRGVGQYGRNGVLEKIVQLDDVVALEEEGPDGSSIDARIAEFAALEAGWLEGDGDAFDAERLRALGTALKDAVRTSGTAEPYLYPTVEGTVRIEWSLDAWEIGAVADLETGLLYVDAVDVSGAHASLEYPWRVRGFEELMTFVAERNHQEGRVDAGE